MNALLDKAIRLLTQRDHSEQELRRKLTTQSCFAKKKSFHDASESAIVAPEQIEQIIQYCYQRHWLNDHTYAQKFVTMRSEKGYGLQRIKLELQQRGISRDLVYTVLHDCEVDWSEIAYKLVKRRFGDISSLEWKDKAKIQRYLTYRGFFQEEIQAVFEKNID